MGGLLPASRVAGSSLECLVKARGPEKQKQNWRLNSLDYPLFNRNWSIEIIPNCLPELIELNHLKSAVPASSRDRLYEIMPLSEAWSLFDKLYGQNLDFGNKL